MARPIVVQLLVMSSVSIIEPSSMAPAEPGCAEAYRVSREEILQAMGGHGAYNITSTTTSVRFAAEALLAIVQRRKREAPGSTHLWIDHADWFAAHLETAGVSYAEMSEAARASFEHGRDALIDYGPGVLAQVVEGPVPLTALDVTIVWPDTGDAPSEFSYRDTLSHPQVDVYHQRVVRFKLLEYEDLLLFDRISGISVRPIGFLSAVFAVLGKPDLRQNRIAVSSDQWQVMRGQVNVFAGISKTGMGTIDPEGRGHEGVPRDRADLRALAGRMKQPLELRYGPPSCQTELAMQRRSGADCLRVMGGVGTCAEH
ncbi:MAG TPA: hypothetical protein VMN37_03955 [Gemmatimonadales bacterium]|nr:hypothetical protein [Gemmatimonadales bacterium]